ncbi:MAG: tetratricopeptide repeat protein [Leptospirales bacterium]
MTRKPTTAALALLIVFLSACASSPPLPDWVATPGSVPGVVRTVGFGEGKDVPTAMEMARRHALLQIVDSVFGERIRYRYQKAGHRDERTDAASVRDFFEAASRGTLVGQRVVHNEVRKISFGYTAYVMVEVPKKDLEKAYRRFVLEEKARRQLYEAEVEGASLLDEGHFRKALRYYRRRVAKEPEGDVWWIGVGAALYRLGHFDEALEATDRALGMNRRSFYGYWNRASILEHLGRLQEGVADRQEACRIRPSEACSARLAADRLRLSLEGR